jgi:hypothetical protein
MQYTLQLEVEAKFLKRIFLPHLTNQSFSFAKLVSFGDSIGLGPHTLMA